jgi:hypothetical protein
MGGRCLQSKCATNCAMAPVSRAPSPRASRPTHDGTPVHRYGPISEPPQFHSASGTHLRIVCTGVEMDDVKQSEAREATSTQGTLK